MTKTKLLDIAIFAIFYWIIRLAWEYLQDGIPEASFMLQEAFIGLLAGILITFVTAKYRDTRS